MSLYNSYLIVFYLGKFFAGVLFGLIPMVVFFTKRNIGFGITAPIICGLLALFNSWASIIAALILLVIAIAVPKSDKSVEKAQEVMDEIKKEEKSYDTIFK